MENSQAKDLLAFAMRRQTTQLFKTFLVTLEEITADHDEALMKLRAVLPPEQKHCVDLAAYLTESKCERLRKAVLGVGNDTIRAQTEELEKYYVSFK
jgi:hypothetical protein